MKLLCWLTPRSAHCDCEMLIVWLKAIDYIFLISFGAFFHLSTICQITLSVTGFFFALIRENFTKFDPGQEGNSFMLLLPRDQSQPIRQSSLPSSDFRVAKVICIEVEVNFCPGVICRVLASRVEEDHYSIPQTPNRWMVEMGDGDVLISGFLRKSPPETKLKVSTVRVWAKCIVAFEQAW